MPPQIATSTRVDLAALLDAEVLDRPDSVEPLVDYFRSISGEHPDWDEYRRAMNEQRRVLLAIAIEHVGPDRQG
jgi:hypothetical protein